MELTKQIQIVIKATNDDTQGCGDFTDALYYPIDSLPTDDQIQADAQARIDNFVNVIQNPPEPTEEQLQAESDAAQAQIDQLQDPDWIQEQVDNLSTTVTEVSTKISNIKSGGEVSLPVDD
jgi:hypothetical protein